MNYEQEEAKFVDAVIAGNLALMECEEIERHVSTNEHGELTIDVKALKPLPVSWVKVDLIVDGLPPEG